MCDHCSQKNCLCEISVGWLGGIISENIFYFSNIGIFSDFGTKALFSFQLSLLQIFVAKQF